MRASAVFVAFAAAAESAQVQNYTSSLNMTIDPNTVPQQQRAVWCQGQTNSCQVLCNTNTNKNDCNQANLSYDCICASNNSAPGLQYYTQTMPTFICQQLFSNCIQQNVGSQDGQQACTTNIDQRCGTINPPEDSADNGDSSSTATESATATGSSTTAAPTGSASNPAGGAAKSSTSSDFAGPTLAPAGTGAVAVAAIGFLAYLL